MQLARIVGARPPRLNRGVRRDEERTNWKGHMKLKTLPSLLVALGVVSCTVGGGPRSEVRTLSSGKPLRVLGVGTMNFTEGSPALMLRYQTDLKLEDQVALRKEADEIWADFKSDVERANVGSAILSANSVPQGTIIQKSQSYNFVFVKDPNGEWKCTNDK